MSKYTSLTIIDNIRPKSAKYVRVPHPKDSEFRTTYEREAYWAEEKRRWVEGYSGLTGRHYSYIQNGTIYDQDTAKYFPPMWRDGDDIVFDWIDETIKNNEDGMLASRRGFGKSALFMGWLPLYEILMREMISIPYTSANKKKIEDARSNVFIPMYNGLNKNLKLIEIDSNPTTLTYGDEEYQKYFNNAKKKVNQETLDEMTGKVGRILTYATDTDPTAFEGIRTLLGVIDEIFIHPKLADLRRSIKACFSAGITKSGSLFMTGSSNTVYPQSLQNAKTLWESSSALGISPLFVSGVMCNNMYMVNGHTDEKKAREHILRERERLDTPDTQDDLKSWIVQYPLSIDEMFSQTSAEKLSKSVINKIELRKKEIISSGISPKKVRLKFEGQNVISVPDLNGDFVIIIEPEENFASKDLFISATDPIPAMEGQDNKGSRFALGIMNRSSKDFCAYYCERLDDTSTLVEKAILLQSYYFKAKNLVENNAGGIFINEFKNLGLAKEFLQKKISGLDNPYSKNVNAYGIRSTPKSNADAHRLLEEYILKYPNIINNLEIINDLLNNYNVNKNADLSDMIKWLVYYDAYLGKFDDALTEEIDEYPLWVLQNVNGRYERVQVMIPTKNKR